MAQDAATMRVARHLRERRTCDHRHSCRADNRRSPCHRRADRPVHRHDKPRYRRRAGPRRCPVRRLVPRHRPDRSRRASPGGAPMTDLAARPHGRLVRVRDALTPREWARAGATAATIIGLHVLGWGMLAAAVGGHYHITRTEIFGFGTGILAYTLGMRHAFDADHIAAIDNTTRKLVSDGKRPLSVGFFFSLGHSSVVFVLALVLNFGIRALDEQVKNSSSHLQYTTNIIGTLVSGIFLFLIAAINVVILAGIVKVFRGMR